MERITKEAVVGTLDGQPLRAEFPLRATVFGVDAVVIPAEDYERLMKGPRSERFVPVRPVRLAEPMRRPLPSTIERDPEVAAFLREAFKRPATLLELHNACAERFGAERTPSMTRISGFRIRTRDGG